MVESYHSFILRLRTQAFKRPVYRHCFSPSQSNLKQIPLLNNFFYIPTVQDINFNLGKHKNYTVHALISYFPSQIKFNKHVGKLNVRNNLDKQYNVYNNLIIIFITIYFNE